MEKIVKGMYKGRVKFFCTKGYGFITEDGTGIEHFVHANDCLDAEPLEKNQQVTFNLGMRDHRSRAVDVTTAKELLEEN